MLAGAHSQRSNSYQISMGFFLLASGSSRAEFEVLQHAGLVTAYPTALRHMKKLSAETLEEIQQIVRRYPFLLLWDNINFAFKVAEQRLGRSRSTFESGTMSTLVLLHGVDYGELGLDLLPPVTTTRPYIKISPSDVHPSPVQVAELEVTMKWHIRDMFLDLYPALRTRLGTSLSALPETESIPLHKTKCYTMPAMDVDESTIEGTMDFFDKIFGTHLQLDKEDIQRGGIVLGAGDLLSNIIGERVRLHLDPLKSAKLFV
jgi:hypothetical protein